MSDKSEKILIYNVEAIRYSILKSNPPMLFVHAEGDVNTSGWTFPELVLKPQTTEELLEYDFVAVKPGGIQSQVITPINAQIICDRPFEKIKKIKVNGANGDFVEIVLGEADKKNGTTLKTTLGEIGVFTPHLQKRIFISELIGLDLRVIRPDDLITMDYRSNRVNINVDGFFKIIKIWFG